MATTRDFRSGGRVTRITRSGRDDGPGYVLVHGIGMAHEYWSGVATELGRSGTVYALDLPGFGDAPQPDEPLTIRGAGDLLADLVRAEGIAEPVLVGHSAGAQAVAEAAAWHPELFDRIVLIGPTVNPRERTARKQALRLLQDLSLTRPKVLGLGIVSYAKAGIGWYLESLPPVMEHRMELTLPRVPARTLVIRGQHDRLVPRDWAERVARLVPDGRYAEVPGRGHETMITAGARVADLIARHARGEEAGRVLPPDDGAVVVPARPLPPLPKMLRWWALDYVYAGWRQLAVLGAWKVPAAWSRGDAARPTIVLLPGVYEHWSFLRLLGDELNARGHRIRVVHGLGANL
ncbi:MAG TPA: alpha/beta hydrolase, partial [Agromyces sp.]